MSTAEPIEEWDALEAPLDEGTRIGGYRIIAPIAEGGQGSVYRAEHLVLGTEVAIKVSHPETRELGRRRFFREARLCARVRHRNVVHVFDVGLLDDRPYLVMELLDGVTLAHVVARGPLPPATTIELGVQLLAAVHAMAEQSIVHRDIKPDNILLCRSIDGYVSVKLLDFGVSRSGRVDRSEVAVTREGTVVGTPRYMSPEQLRAEDVDVRGDLYAVSAVLYECLVGAPVHRGDSMTEIFASILARDPPPLRAAAPSCPADLAAIIHEGLSRERDERPAHPARMAERLRGVAHALALPRGEDAWMGLLDDPAALTGTAAFPLRRERASRAATEHSVTAPPVLSRLRRGPLSVALGAALVVLGGLVAAGLQWRRPPVVRASSKALIEEPRAVSSVPAVAPARPATASRPDVVARPEIEPSRAVPPASDHPTTPSTDELERSARALFLRGEDASALALYEQVTRREPRRAEAWRDLGVIATERGRRATARRALRRYLRLRPHATDAPRIRVLLRETAR